ncbi:hypothetical protein [Methanococcoides burtonii]|uniref:Uncharacterized protein n=1 Tax=Methanococcoides burtonii (strain DSM 6242 / NBRC 107633 / OCM 468 / ACE-M) TaxID=259564 RepID=Q12U35_METBU|nr:hypothetical protein [Methanococcoides burtonii]ABE53041.1 Hypothetical protein Mbur_2176 [Methanococcoides burtonii DSM 6242]
MAADSGKAWELSHQLAGKRKTIEFSKPVYVDERDDTDLLRKMIIDIPYAKWKKMGFSKGTLHYMKQKAKSVSRLLSMLMFGRDWRVGNVNYNV